MASIKVSFTAGEEYYSVYLKQSIFSYFKGSQFAFNLYPLTFQYDFCR